MTDLEKCQAEIRRLRAIISDIEEEKRKQEGGIISGKEVKRRLKKFLGNKITLTMNDVVITDVLTYDERYKVGNAYLSIYDDCNYSFETCEYYFTHIRIEKA